MSITYYNNSTANKPFAIPVPIDMVIMKFIVGLFDRSYMPLYSTDESAQVKLTIDVC